MATALAQAVKSKTVKPELLDDLRSANLDESYISPATRKLLG